MRLTASLITLPAVGRSAGGSLPIERRTSRDLAAAPEKCDANGLRIRARRQLAQPPLRSGGANRQEGWINSKRPCPYTGRFGNTIRTSLVSRGSRRVGSDGRQDRR